MPALTSYLQREALKKTMWEAKAQADIAYQHASAANEMRDWEAAYDTAEALRKACDAWAAFGKGMPVRETAS